MVDLFLPGARLHVLGPLRLTVDGAARPLGGPQQRAVLAILTMRRGFTVSSDALVDALWPDSPPPGAAASVHVLISKLRGVLAVASPAPKDLLATVAPGYRLALPQDGLDAGVFARLTRLGDEAARQGDAEAASARYGAALDQWSGQVLEDLRGFGFVEDYAAPLERERLAAQVGRGRAETLCGRPEGVVADLAALTRAHPLHEPAWEALVTSLYLAGHAADALDACRRARAVLAEELGQDPSPPLRELEVRVLRHEPLPGLPTARERPLASTEVDRVSTVAALVDGNGERFPVGRGALRIGRAPDNTIVVADARASRRHAAVVRGAGGYLVRDLHSSNGTFVNGARVEESAPLRHGDTLEVGGAVLRFEAPGG